MHEILSNLLLIIPCCRSGITPDLMKNIIDAIQPLLTVNVMPSDASDDGLISRDDQLYLYEVIGVLIVSGETESHVSLRN